MWVQFALVPVLAQAEVVISTPMITVLAWALATGSMAFLKLAYLPHMPWATVALLGSGHLWFVLFIGYFILAIASIYIVIPTVTLAYLWRVCGRWWRGQPLRLRQVDFPITPERNFRRSRSGVDDAEPDSRGPSV